MNEFEVVAALAPRRIRQQRAEPLDHLARRQAGAGERDEERLALGQREAQPVGAGTDRIVRIGRNPDHELLGLFESPGQIFELVAAGDALILVGLAIEVRGELLQ
jgi:hypothetical protein